MDCHTSTSLPGEAGTAPRSSRSLPGWLPFLWSQVLFPGRAISSAGRWHWLSVVLLLVGPALLLYPGLAFPLIEPDESRYAQIPFEMQLRGDYLVPRLQGEPYLDKPPLFYWMVAGCYRVFGVHEWVARLVPALSLHVCILLTYWFGRRWLGEASALRGALVLGLAPGYMTVGRLLLLDGLLALWIVLGLGAAFEAIRGERFRWGWWFLAAIACGLGILTKGPVALLLILPPLWLHGWLTARGPKPGAGGWLAFVLLAVLVALPWYVALCFRMPGFLRYFFWEHHVLRFLTPYAHAHAVWFYGPVLLLGLLPATLWLIPFVRFLFSGTEEAASNRPMELGFLLLAGGWCVFFFTLSTGKLPTYILPAFPPLALALGHLLAQPRWSAARLPVVTAGLAYGLLLLGHHAALPWYADYRSPMNRADEVRRFCGDREQPVICYPRNCDSVGFYTGRADIQTFRSKDIEELRTFVRTRPRTVVLCTHRHSLRGLKQLLPPEVVLGEEAHFGLAPIPGVPRRWMSSVTRLLGETAWGLCDALVVEMPAPAPLPATELRRAELRLRDHK